MIGSSPLVGFAVVVARGSQAGLPGAVNFVVL